MRKVNIALVALSLALLTGCTHNLGHTLYFTLNGIDHRMECSSNKGSIEAPVYVCTTDKVNHSEVMAYQN